LRAQFVAWVAALGRVFDNDKRNLSIKTLLRAAPQFEEIETVKLETAKNLWKKHAKNLRHQIVAHNAGSTPPQEVLKRANVTLDDIEKLIKLCEDLLDAWTQHAECHMHILSSSKADTLALLDALLHALNRD
jgi:hypothetical protein